MLLKNYQLTLHEYYKNVFNLVIFDFKLKKY